MWISNIAERSLQAKSSASTDFTVFTEAGAALFDGRNLYRVTNPRGWYYLYPSLFALRPPLSFLDSRSQVFIWYLISIASGFGCYDEACRIWAATRPFPRRGWEVIVAGKATSRSESAFVPDSRSPFRCLIACSGGNWGSSWSIRCCSGFAWR